jgi:uncharacterized protein YjbJ (UPF0337 family)
MLLRVRADEPSGSPALTFLLVVFVRPVTDTSGHVVQTWRDRMGFLDKLLGRGKKAAGDVTGDSSLRREGVTQEREANAEDRAAQHEQMAQEQRDQAAQARADSEQS